MTKFTLKTILFSTICLLYCQNKLYADTYSHTITAKTWSAYGIQTLSGVDWNATATGGAYWGYDATKGQQFGSASSPANPLSMTTSGISGTISSIKVTTSGASSIIGTVTVSVGGISFSPASITLTATSTDYTFTGSNSGNILINWAQTSSKALYLKAIEVTYSAGATPTITTPSPTSISTFASLLGNASPSQTFTVGGTNLTADLVVTAPTNFEVRENGIGSYASSVSFTPALGIVDSKTIEVRIAGSASAGSVSGNVVCSSTGASSKNVAVSGEVASAAPTITVTEVFVPDMNAVIGEQDAETINISGANLTENIVLSIDGTHAAMFSVVTNPNPLTLAGGTAIITYIPTTSGSHTATLHVNSAGAPEITRTLNGSASFANPVATDATAISSVGFNANWNQVAGAVAYELSVDKIVSGTVFSDLIISEYVEGTSNNKAIEIFNGTGVTIDLSAYSIKKQTNGANSYSNELVLTGTLENNDLCIIAHTSANATILGLADITKGSAPIDFNGNDAVGLFKNGVLVDEVGVFNQVSDWGKDLTLIRKSSVSSPKATYDVSEWDILATDYITNLNSHSTNLQSITPIAGSPFTINSGNTTTYAIIGLMNQSNYSYKVRATDGNNFTPYSNAINVTTSPSTGLKDLQTSKVYTLNGNILINADIVNKLEIFNSVGQKLMDRSIQAGLNTINVNAKGVLFVKLGNEVTKVIL